MVALSETHLTNRDLRLLRGDPMAKVEGVARWRDWATAHRAAAALLAGVVATHIATVFGFMEVGVGLPRLDYMTQNGGLYLPKASPNVQFLTGGILHYADGIVFAVLFAAVLHPVLPWRSTPIGNILKGMFLGTILATIVVAFLANYV